MAEWREKAKEPREHRSVIEGLQERAKHLSARSTEMEKLAEAAKPLYDSLDDAQKRRFKPLLHIGYWETLVSRTRRLSPRLGLQQHEDAKHGNQ
jgi:hypothetical protein